MENYGIISKDVSKNYIASLIPKGAKVLDIGSFDGKDALELADACNTMVDCFEPNPEAYGRITDDRLIIWPYAIGAFHGKIQMNVSNHPQSNTIREPKLHKKIFPDVIYTDKITVNITTLDLWNHRVNYNGPIDLIWCDVNGAEADFLKGAAQTLKITDYLYIEYCEKELFSKCLNKAQMIKALPGFEVMGEYNVGPSYGNLLFKRKGV